MNLHLLTKRQGVIRQKNFYLNLQIMNFFRLVFLNKNLKVLKAFWEVGYQLNFYHCCCSLSKNILNKKLFL